MTLREKYEKYPGTMTLFIILALPLIPISIAIAFLDGDIIDKIILIISSFLHAFTVLLFFDKISLKTFEKIKRSATRPIKDADDFYGFVLFIFGIPFFIFVGSMKILYMYYSGEL